MYTTALVLLFIIKNWKNSNNFFEQCINSYLHGGRKSGLWRCGPVFGPHHQIVEGLSLPVQPLGSVNCAVGADAEMAFLVPSRYAVLQFSIGP